MKTGTILLYICCGFIITWTFITISLCSNVNSLERNTRRLQKDSTELSQNLLKCNDFKFNLLNSYEWQLFGRKIKMEKKLKKEMFN
jgi:hypothetical protein